MRKGDKIPPFYNDRGKKYTLCLITKTNIYYADYEEFDDNANTLCFSLEMELRSNNYHASNALITDIIDKNYTWVSEELQYHISLMPEEFKRQETELIQLELF